LVACKFHLGNILHISYFGLGINNMQRKFLLLPATGAFSFVFLSLESPSQGYVLGSSTCTNTNLNYFLSLPTITTASRHPSHGEWLLLHSQLLRSIYDFATIRVVYSQHILLSELLLLRWIWKVTDCVINFKYARCACPLL
jgi:hypothetical protein